MGIKCELYNDNFQNFKRYNIPKAQLVIADIPYNIGVDAYASNPMWYKKGDNKNGESSLARQSFFHTDGNFKIEKLAKVFCRDSKIGKYSCAVTTRFGFCCDLCLEEELLYLKSVGVHTVASCCGHGNVELASILTVGENSREKMKEMGYEFLCCL